VPLRVSRHSRTERAKASISASSFAVLLAGPVPAPLQLYAAYDSAVLAKAAAPEPALAFVKFLASDAARQARMSAGFEMLPAP
jgi:ABC-type molybdate transport system substrate-binding protein